MSAESRWAAVAALGQSVWYDNVARPALAGGHLAQLVDHDHVTGGTSNPSIFAKAVLDSDVYDDELGAAPASDSDAEVFERCWIADIQRACDLLRPVWEGTGGRDGYISIEEEADLAFEVEPAVARAHELRALVGRPNVMVKVPGTDAGVEAFRRLTREGLSINMTLLFSRERYRQIAEAYIAALSERVDAGEDVSAIASVASFFVSRIDVQADERLPEDSPLRGRIAVANAKLAYADVFLPTHSGPLIGEDTVTTVPDATLDAFRDAPDPAPDRFTVLDGIDRARADLTALAEAGVDLDEITADLERAGVKQFADAYAQMLDAITRKRARIAVS